MRFDPVVYAERDCSNISDVKAAIAAGVKFIQYRNKEASTKYLYVEALKLRKLCKNSQLIINDRVDIALAVGADGVHLGKEDLPYNIARKLLGKRKIIGLTVHNLKEALVAQKLGANYLGVSPIFSTATKRDAGLPCGIELVKKIKKQIHIPIVAIGGINLSNAKQVIMAGADAICAISAVVTAPNVRKEIEKFQKLFFGAILLVKNKSSDKIKAEFFENIISSFASRQPEEKI